MKVSLILVAVGILMLEYNLYIAGALVFAGIVLFTRTKIGESN